MIPCGNRHIRAFDVRGGCELVGGQAVTEVNPGVSDGLQCDNEGYIWTSADDGFNCYAQDCVLLSKILSPEIVANVTFGRR